MKVRILLLVAFLYLPNFLIGQDLSIQKSWPISLHQKQISNSSNQYPTVSDERSLYIIRIVGEDKEDYINFYGISIGGVHANPNANFSGFCLNMGLGSLRRYETYISINGVNISFFGLSTEGTINGFSLGTLFNSAIHANGILIGAIAGSDYLNGIVLGGLMSYSQYANAIQISVVFNTYCNFNGVGISLINSSWSGFEKLMNSVGENTCHENKMYGLILGLYNAVDVKGLSLALVNNGNGWFQIGIVNIGDTVLQIGLVNLDADGKMGVPIINVNF